MATRIPDDAFDYYVSLGSTRSYRAVSSKYGVSKRAVTKFAARKSWAQRLEHIEEELRERTDKKLVDSMEEMQNRHVQTLRAIQGRALEGLKQFPLTSGMEAVRAAELAIKLERLIAGEPTERNALSIEEVTRREIGELLVVSAGSDEDEAEDEDDQDDW